MKLYTDFAKMNYVMGAIDVLVKQCKSENATNEEKNIADILTDILKVIQD